MNTQDFFSTAAQAKDLIAGVSTVIFFLFAFLYVRGRAGSAVFLLDRLWRVLGGKKDFHDPSLQDEHHRLSDFEKYNYSRGIRFQSYKKIEEARLWLQERDIGMEELVRVKSYFNSNDVSIRAPRIISHKLLNRAMLVMFLFGAAVTAIAQAPAALLTIKKTGTVIWASTSEVRSWDGLSWRVTADDCVSGNVHLDEHDKKVVCDILTEDGVESVLKEAMLSQRILAIFIWAMIGLLAYVAAREYSIARQALELHKRALENSPSQLNLSV
ncbi:DUF6216 family protein [Pseudomonas sp. J452]|uniref:DUF6216 family protein n=1 Tax=Pseudomonas sp. J452 TaxID=2898441 RepID=UPI0021ADD89A|nr:DUF6216 family protein [Pseudomonas sp. J452]UUY07732.1 DUF6216 family protein [Pseudomonas sp. J452]